MQVAPIKASRVPSGAEEHHRKDEPGVEG